MQKHINKPSLRVGFLGGVGEIGKNMTILEFGEDIIVIDCGSSFPNIDMPGVDLVIPDPTYLIENKDRVRGIVLTHGHEDHIGALPYILKDLNVNVYGTKLTLALVENKLKEHHVEAELITVKPKTVIKLGKNFKVEFIGVNHSIAGSCALSIETPLGRVFHTGDFKVDYTPIDGNIIDLQRISELGKDGVLLLLGESTNIERPGYTMSEATVGKSLNNIFSENTDRRIFIATFASNIHRIQQILDLAEKYKRKVALLGRSLINVVDCAAKINELHFNRDNMIDAEKINKYADNELVIILTGSQGEPMSALTRMASDVSKIKLGYNDTVIISASPIPGNERMIYNVINNLYRHGARVIYESLHEIHVSGHACQEELKLIHTLLKPKFFIPIHGEHRHQKKHAELAVSIGMQPYNIMITDIGNVVEVTEKTITMKDNIPSGQLLVDGLNIGDEGSGEVIRDRRHLSEEGLFVVVVCLNALSGEVNSVDISTRGFIMNKESDDKLLESVKDLIIKLLSEFDLKSMSGEYTAVKNTLRKEIKTYLFKKIRRNPMILPMILEN